MIELGGNRYGKRDIRLVKVDRREDRHELRDLTLDVTLEGDFAAAHTEGDNARVVATDTMKNTVYALAPEQLTGAIEAFGLALVRRFLEPPQVGRAVVDIREHAWRRLDGATGPAPDAFQRLGEMTRIANVTGDRVGIRVESGVRDLVVLKTARSAFTGFPRDRYTTLPEAGDRIMATRIAATWRHGDHAAGEDGAASADGIDWDASHRSVVDTLLEVFADHDSRSVQHSLWLIGRAILERHPALVEVRMTLPNLHHWLVDLEPFGGTNRGEIFVATRAPYGEIEATVRRSTPAPPDGAAS